VKAKVLDAKLLTDPVGGQLTLQALAEVEKGFTADRLARAVTTGRMQQLVGPLVNHAQQHQAQWLKGGKWDVPESALTETIRRQRLESIRQDA
jgi:hypothetical protein